MTVRLAFPPKLTPTQLGPTAKPGTCAFAPERGCGLELAHFYIGGWRCGRHKPGTDGGATTDHLDMIGTENLDPRSRRNSAQTPSSSSGGAT